MSPYQPGEQPSFAAPQDPWADVQGSATPTNPIAAVPAQPGPLPQRGQYVPGVAAPAAPTPPGAPPGIWSQETIASGDRYAPPRQRGGAGLYVLVVLLVVVLGGAGGYGAWYFTTKRYSGQNPGPTGTTQAVASSTALLLSCSDAESGFDGCKVQAGDCLSLAGEPNDPVFERGDCADPDTKKVLRVVTGPELGPDGLTSQDPDYLEGLFSNYCAGLDGANYYFAWQYPGIGGDRFYCMASQH